MYIYTEVYYLKVEIVESSNSKLEKVALDGSVRLRLRRDGVILTFDLSTQKRNQVICVPRCTSDKSLAKIYQ